MISPRSLCSGLAMGAAAFAFAAGCMGNDDGNTPASPAPPVASSAKPGTTARPECAGLVTSGQALAATVTQFVNGQATGAQVRAAAQELSSSIDAARTVVGAETSARLDDVKAALQRLQAALTAQPPDLPAVRVAANDALVAMRDAATLCQSSTPAPSR